MATKDDEYICIPKWFFDHILDTLKIDYNNRDVNDECCQDRNVRQALVGLLKLSRGEKLTGAERFERPKWN